MGSSGPDLSFEAAVRRGQNFKLDVNCLPTPNDIESLRKLIDVSPIEAIKIVHRTTVYPCFKIVDTRKNSQITETLLETLDMILNKIPVDFNMYMAYHIEFTKLLYDKSQTDWVATLPEEVLLPLLKAQTSLKLNTTDETRMKLYQMPYSRTIVQMIYLTSGIAQREKYRTLRTQAVTCIMALTGVHDQYMNASGEHKDKKLERRVSKVVCEILPGVLSALHDVAMCNMNPGSALIVNTLCALRRILCLTMNNKYYSPPKDPTVNEVCEMMKDQPLFIQKKKYESNTPGAPVARHAVRSPGWWQMASEKVSLVVRLVLRSQLRAHESWRVRRELAQLAADVLRCCSSTMGPTMPAVLDILLAMSRDEYKEVAQICRQALWQHCDSKPADDSGNVTDALVDLYHGNVLAVPRVVNDVDPAMKVSALRSLAELITLLTQRNGLDGLLTSVSTRNSLFAALIEAARMNVSSVKLLTQTECNDLEGWNVEPRAVFEFQHLDGKCDEELIAVCHALGGAECVELLVDCLMEWMRDRPDDGREVTYLLNYVASGPSKMDKKNVLKRVVEFYLEHEWWNLPFKIGSDEPPLTSGDTLDVSVYDPRAWSKDSVEGLFEGATETRYTDISYQQSRQPRARRPGCCLTLLEAQGNLLQACLLATGLGMMATRLQRDFQPYVMQSMCLVLERAGNEYVALAAVGRWALGAIAQATGCADVSEFICANADYFTFQIKMRLSKAWKCESALKILKVVMDYSNKTVFTCLHSIVGHILESSDQCLKKDIISYLQVFLTFTQCTLKWFPTDANKNQETKPISEYNVCTELVDYLTRNDNTDDDAWLPEDDYEKASRYTVEKMYFDDLREKEENILNHGEEVTEDKPPTPPHITATVSVIKRCINLLPSKVLEEKLLAMDVLSAGLTVLRLQEDELLPVVHLIWAPLVERFRETNPIVLRRSFQLLCVMAAVAKDFIRARVVKEVLPIICEYLKSSAIESHLKDQGSHYRQSNAYRLQEAMLRQMLGLVENLNLDEEHLESVFGSVDVYLSSRQPKPLQELAVQFFGGALRYDRGAVWYHLRKLCKNHHSIQPPKNKFGLVSIVGTPYMSTDTNFDANVKQIFRTNLPSGKQE